MFNSINYHEVIECITGALEERDLYTAGHSCRVSELVKKLSDFMGFDEEQKEFYHVAAHLHDVGKVGVPDGILLKPGKLTDEEFAILKEHPAIGARILMHSPSLAPLAEIVLHHHERFDGKGYPDGLAGIEIPLGSRIIAICDSIDAMLSDRSYRKAFDSEYCRQEIIKNTNTMYDPDIAAVTLKHWQEILDAGYNNKNFHQH